MVKDVKDLEKLLKMCRKQGVTELTLDGVSFKLGDQPASEKQSANTEPFESDEPTDEDLAYWSAGEAQ